MAAVLEFRYTGSAVVTGELVGSGDGVTTSFSSTLANAPAAGGSIVVHYTIGGTAYTATDDGAGTITGTSCSGTVTYQDVNQAASVGLTFTTAPDDLTDVTIDYHCPNLSLGGAATTATISSTAMLNLFDHVWSDEAAAGRTEYRALSIYNSGDAAATLVGLYMDPETTSTSTQLDFYVEGIDPVTPISIADETDSGGALAGATFTHATSAAKLSVADIPAGSEARIWVRRVVTAGATNLTNDTGTMNVDYA